MGENFRRKTRFVSDGPNKKTSTSVMYSRVVSRDSTRIYTTIADLNGLEVIAADVENAFLTDPLRDKVCSRVGPELSIREVKVLIIKQALYGIKSYGSAFCAFLAVKLYDIGFKSRIADPDVWIRTPTNPIG